MTWWPSNDVSFTIRGGEFFSMLGPSGCGKTTTLRMIAGFEQPDAGRVLLQGEDVTWVSPRKRNVNMVFQDYGLFPHMTVAAERRLRARDQARASRRAQPARGRDARRSCASRATSKRRPGQLSGGQQQRVALARALVNRPAALLLDEPLGALDLKLRKEMQLELKAVQSETGTTFVYVTHDQEEALTMSDRIAVMNGGVVEQLADPRELYERPATAFVAGFIGTSNLITLRVDRRGERARAHGSRRGGPDRRRRPGRRPLPSFRSRCARRRSSSSPSAATPAASTGPVVEVVYLGSTTQMIVELPTGERLAVHRLNDDAAGADPAGGDRVALHWAAEHSFVIGGAAGVAAPAAGDDRVTAPRIVVPPPGPRSRELLERAEGMLYPGTGHGLVPFVVARKDGYTITDVDGNVYLDLISASASVPLGACREDIVAPAVEALRRYGNEDSHTMASEPMIALAERLLEIVARRADPGRPGAERHRGGRDGDQDDAPRHRPARRDRLLLPVPRRVDDDGDARRRAERDQPRDARRSRRASPTCPIRIRTARRWGRRGRAAAATRPSTTSATTSSSTRSTRTRWRASSSSRSWAREACWCRPTPSGPR